MSRNMAIKWLKWIQNMFPDDSEQYKALQFAIDSLETDEFYQIEYERTVKKATPEQVEHIKEALKNYTAATVVHP